MINKENVARHLKLIWEELDSLEYHCDTEIVGDDARHLLQDIKAAQREHTRVVAENITSIGEVKCLYDRLKRILVSVRVMKNTLTRCEQCIDEAIASCDSIAQSISEANPPSDEEI